MVLCTACSMGKQSACILFSQPIDSPAASGAILGDVWTGAKMPVVDKLGDEFLETVKTGMRVVVKEDGVVEVESLSVLRLLGKAKAPCFRQGAFVWFFLFHTHSSASL